MLLLSYRGCVTRLCYILLNEACFPLGLIKTLGLQGDISDLNSDLATRGFELEKEQKALDRAKKDLQNSLESYDQLKADLDRARKSHQKQREKLELDLTELRHQIKVKETHLKSANEEIIVLRDQSGGATKALSKEKKRLEEVEDNLQKALTAGRQREASLKSAIDGQADEIARLERKNAEMVRRLHQLDLEKEEIR